MKNILRGGASALLAFAVLEPASAADLSPAPMLVYKAPVTPPWSWTGGYVGVNVGYGWAQDPTTFTDTTVSTVSEFRGVPPLVACVPGGCPALPPGFGSPTSGTASGNADMDGVLGGAQAGYNWQLGAYLLGIEGDIQASGQRGSITLCDTPGCPAGAVLATANYKMPWFGTLRGRLGVIPAPRWLLYITGGLAVGEIEANDTVSVIGGTGLLKFSAHTTRGGWVVGGGAETALSNDWTFKLEYLYMDLGSVGGSLTGNTNTVTASDFPAIGFSTVTVFTTTGTFSTRITDNIVRVGLNYKIPPR